MVYWLFEKHFCLIFIVVEKLFWLIFNRCWIMIWLIYSSNFWNIAGLVIMLLGSPVIFGLMCHFFLTHCPLEGYYAHFFFLFLFLFLWMSFLYLYPSPCSHGPIRGTFWRFNRHISLTIYCHLSLVNNMCNTYLLFWENQ